jgi:hypothetical protein
VLRVAAHFVLHAIDERSYPMSLKRTLAIALAGLSFGAAGVALAGNPNPTESQDAYWDLKDQAAAWRAHRTEKARADERKTPAQPAPVAAPVTERPAKS